MSQALFWALGKGKEKEFGYIKFEMVILDAIFVIMSGQLNMSL